LQDFAYVASHDLQEPLRKIQAFGDRLLTKHAKSRDDERRDYLHRLVSAAARMSSMISDLLAYARVTTQSQPLVPVALSAVVQGVLTDLESSIERHCGQVEVAALPTIQADPLQMQKLLQNLMGNALKFHKPDVPPIVRVSARCESPKQIQILVEDNGIGIDEKYLDRIFQPFQRLHGRSETEYGGSGIELAICQKIVTRHGGSITVKSAPGEGTTFIATLPVESPDSGGLR
jgi:light-regulated signal transduction histidine kinase (bacteriophytochrome)